MSDEQMRHEIMLNVRANGLDVTGEFWLMLIFRTSEQLTEIGREMGIER